MQREEPDGIIIVCDFCGRDWDGAEAMIEGHHGSILCLKCCESALKGQSPGGAKYQCTLCLRFNIPPELPRWSGVSVDVGAEKKTGTVCQECLYQAARGFSRNEDVDWKFDPAAWPALVKVKIEKPVDASTSETAVH